MDWLSSAIAERRAFSLGEVSVGFAGELATLGCPQVDPGAPATDLPPDPDHVQAFLRTGNDGRYRPLSGARGMRTGWRVTVPVEDLPALLDAIYPLAIAHIRAAARGTLRAHGLDDVLARQSGRYEVVAKMPRAQQEAAVESLCSRCVRVPVWREGSQAAGAFEIPCPEACSVLVALCREIAVDPAGASADTDITAVPVQFADFESPANEIAREVRRRIAGV